MLNRPPHTKFLTVPSAGSATAPAVTTASPTSAEEPREQDRDSRAPSPTMHACFTPEVEHKQSNVGA